MNIREDQYIHLMADCFPVKGVKNSAIYDLSRGHIHSFPSDFFDTFKAIDQYTYGSLKAMAAQNDSLDVFEEFVDFLDQHDMVMALDEAERSLFPKIEMDHWDKPCVIQNAIIDIKDTDFDFENIFSQLDDFGCEHVQIRQYGNHYSLLAINRLLKFAYNKSMLGVELLLAYDPSADESDYKKLLVGNPIISSICVHGAPENKAELVDLDRERPGLFGKGLSFITMTITSSDHCGVIGRGSFAVPKTDIVSEFKQFNGCLNRKISIDHKGEIKNCPSMQRSYGKIGRTTLAEALAATGFKDGWTRHKDIIEICKVCEYRYVCSDCRAYTQGGDVLAKPEKCKYDPYTGTWANERT